MAGISSNVLRFLPDGTVTVDGLRVGTWRRPDPSGASHVRTPVWVFKAWDGVSDNANTRKALEPFARSAKFRYWKAQRAA